MTDTWWDEAADPSTAPDRLRELSGLDRRLWPALAANPSTYPELVSWLAAHGDQTVRAAIAARSATPGPPPPPMPGPPAPATPAGSRAGVAAAIVVATVAVLAATAGGTAWALTAGDDGPPTAAAAQDPPPDDEPDTDTNDPDASVASPRGSDDHGVRFSPADAGATAVDRLVEVEVYEDVQCPACQSFFAMSGEFLTQQVAEGSIALTYRPFSFLDRASRNNYSSRATNAAFCVLDAAGVLAFVKFHTHLYDHQPPEGTAGPEDDELIDAAAALDVTGIDRCVTGGSFLGWIAEAREEAMGDGISGTPTVLINGRESTARTPAELADAIASARQGSPRAS